MKARIDRLWCRSTRSFTLIFRDIRRVWFRIVPATFEEIFQATADPQRPNRDWEWLRQRTPAAEWVEELPPAPTANRQVRIDLPQVPPGGYFLLASWQAGFPEVRTGKCAVDVWVSDLAVVFEGSGDPAAQTSGVVVEAVSGHPVSAAHVELWHAEAAGEPRRLASATTNPLGFFELRADRPGQWIRVYEGDRQLALRNPYLPHGGEPADHLHQLVSLVTDRELYLAGDCVRFKGFTSGIPAGGFGFRPLPGLRLTLRLNGAGKILASQGFVTNNLSAFSGEFPIPADQPPGALTLEPLQPHFCGESKVVSVVEAPKASVRVRLDPPFFPPRLRARVTVPGWVILNSGRGCPDAKVEYDVHRARRAPTRSDESDLPEFIGRGRTRTGPDGFFAVEFAAWPQPGYADDVDPCYEFRIRAFVEDPCGEQSAAVRIVMVERSSFRLSVEAVGMPTATEPVALQVRARAPDGKAYPAAGQLRIWRIREPAAPHAARSPSRTPLDGIPLPPPTAAEWSCGWVDDGAPWESGFVVDATGTATAHCSLGGGEYRVAAEAKEFDGRSVVATNTFAVIDPAGDPPAVNVPHLLAARGWSVEPGEEFTALWGTNAEQGRALVEIESSGRVVRRYWTSPERGFETLRIPAGKSMGAGTTLHVIRVRENRAYVESRVIEVRRPPGQLRMTWERVSHVLTPGGTESWTLSVQRIPADGAPGVPAEAEVLAVLYDASRELWSRKASFRKIAEIWNLRRGPGLSHRFGNVGVWGLCMSSDDLGPGGDSGRGCPGTQSGAIWTRHRPTEAPLDDEEVHLDYMIQPRGPDSDPWVPEPCALPRTVLFMPQLRTDATGLVHIPFTAPKEVGRWGFLAFAHDQELRAACLEHWAITQ
jgi:hypothetical protein